MTAITDSWQHEYITTNGVKLHYVTQGNGALMLMLHGFPEFWYSWRHQIPAFAPDYQVVALDLRGYNDSDKPKAQSAYVMDEFIKDIEGVITGLGYDKCVLVGHDWGGAIAWHFAYSRPQMVEKLIVLNMPHPARMAEGLRTPGQLLRSWYMFFFQLPEIPEALIQALMLLQDQIQLERRPLSAVIGDDLKPVYKPKMMPERDRKNAQRIAVKNLRSMDEIK